MTDEKTLIAQFHTLTEKQKAEIAEHIERLAKIVTENGQKQKRRRPKAGSMPGLFKMSPDFDDPA